MTANRSSSVAVGTKRPDRQLAASAWVRRRMHLPNMITRYRFSTRIGMFCIEMLRTGAWRSMFGRKELGVFTTAEAALVDLLEDQRDWPGGARNSSLGLPTDLEKWAPSKKAPK